MQRIRPVAGFVQSCPRIGRNAASDLPLPVGAQSKRFFPAVMASQASRCAGVGLAYWELNQARKTGGRVPSAHSADGGTNEDSCRQSASRAIAAMSLPYRGLRRLYPIQLAVKS